MVYPQRESLIGVIREGNLEILYNGSVIYIVFSKMFVDVFM